MMDFFENVLYFMLHGIGFMVTLTVIVLSCVARMEMFRKAGVAGYKAWIPFYRDYVLCQISMGNGWFFLLGIFPFTIPVLRVLLAIEVTAVYGGGVLQAILYFFFSTIMEFVYGFGSATYRGPKNIVNQIKGIFAGN
ncbi:MAG: DUF5684 domain-containing protein [Eubacteriales bacterium]|nr:DUF5684 domain-containing protein [Eubacteriales bacterium]